MPAAADLRRWAELMEGRSHESTIDSASDARRDSGLEDGRRNLVHDPGPLGEVDRASIDVMIGDALGVQPDRGEALFDGDTLHAERFVDRIGAPTRPAPPHRRHSGRAGIPRLDPLWPVRQVLPTNNKLQNFFTVQVQICLHGETLCSTERTVLSVSSDGSARHSSTLQQALWTTSCK